jgi:hypothetical protein
MRYRVIWYEGFGEHEYIEASRADYETLADVVKGICGVVSDDELFETLDRGRSDVIYWVRDDLGFELVQL